MKMKLFIVLVCVSIVLTSCASTAMHENDLVSGNEIDDIITSEKDLTDSQTPNEDEYHLSTEVNDTLQESASEVNDEPQPTGGVNLCEIHSIDFHTFTGEMIEYVGEDRFNEWFENCSGKNSEIDGCIHYANIYRFIEYFEFPKEVFEELYYGTITFYFSDYNVDLLYSADASTVSQYYMSYAEREEEREKYSSLGEIKLGIMEYAMMSTEENIKGFYETYCKDRSIVEWSIADFVRTTGIKKNDLQALIGDITVREYPGMTIVLECFDFDYDIVYSDTTLMKKTTADESVVDKHNEDMNFCRQSQLSVGIAFENVSVD